MADFQTAYEIEGLAFDDSSGIFTGDTNPRVVSPGIGIPESTLYIRKDNNTIYQKIGPLDTDWSKINAKRAALTYAGRAYLNANNAKGFNLTYGVYYHHMSSTINLANVTRNLTGFKIPFNSTIKKITLNGRASSSDVLDFDILFLTQEKNANSNTVTTSAQLGLKNIVTNNTRNQIYSWSELDFSGVVLNDTEIFSMVFRRNNAGSQRFFYISSIIIELEEDY